MKYGKKESGNYIGINLVAAEIKKVCQKELKSFQLKMFNTTGLVLDLHIQLVLEKNLAFRQFKME